MDDLDPSTILSQSDQLLYYARYLSGAALALAAGFVLHARNRDKDHVDRLCIALCPLSIYLCLTSLLLNVLQAPFSDWNAGRLSPAMGLLHGAKLYYGPGSGPVLNTIYPPMSAVVYLPAGLFSNPTAAIMAGTCISITLFFLPIALLCFAPHGEGEGRRSPLFATFALLGFYRLAMTSALSVACCIHADSPAVGFAALACLPLYLRRARPEPPTWAFVTSALFATLSVWSKQTLAPLLVALPFWVLLAHGFRASLRFSAILGGVLAVGAVVFKEAFGFASFTFNVFRLPKSHPWIFPDVKSGFAVLLFELAFACGPIVVMILLSLYLRRQGRPDSGEESGPGGRLEEAHAWFRGNAWVMFAGAGLAMIPTALLGRIKVGGNPNNYAPPLYFLSASLLVILLDWYARNRERGQVRLNGALTAALILSFVSPLMAVNGEVPAQLSAIRPVALNAQEQAFRYALGHPGQAYFPWNPLSTLLAEGRLYHFDYGMIDRELAGYPVSREHFFKHVPANLRVVCFPPRRQDEWAMKFFQDFTKRVRIKELPGWICYER